MRSYRLLFVAGLALAACSKSTEPAKSGSGSTAAPAPGSGTGSGSGSGPGSVVGTTSAPPTDPGPGSSSDAGSAAAAGSGSGSGSGTFDFDKLSYDEKRAFMKEHVVPTMKPLFQNFDGDKFASVGCKTCHGKEPQKSKYKMPSPDLPKLDFAAIKAGKQKPEMAKWMSEVVKPEMAKLLQQPEMSTSNPDGFGCLECHQKK